MLSLKRKLKNILISIYRSVKFDVDYNYDYLKHRMGERVWIGRESVFQEIDGITIGNDVYIGPWALMSGSGQLNIGNNVAIGPKVTIYTSSHDYLSGDYVPYGPGLIKKPVVIKDHVWIGGNVVILPGVTVNEGSIIAAGSVVTKSVPKCTIVAGNPAKVVKSRDETLFDSLVREEKFYIKQVIEELTGNRSH